MQLEILKSNIGNQPVNAINARDLWNILESKQEFSHWIKNRIEKLNLVENKDFCLLDNFIVQANKGNAGGHNKIEYILTLDIAKHLALIEQTQKGYEVREYFIECEKRLHQPQLPKTFSEALRMLADSVDENHLLREQIQANTPLVNLATQITQSSGSLSIGDFAKVISKKDILIGQKRLFAFLREQGFLTSKNIPYQKYIERGIFEVIEKKIPNLLESKIYTQTFITPKGQAHILNSYVFLKAKQ